MKAGRPISRFLARIVRYNFLSDEDHRLIEALPIIVRNLPAGCEISGDSDGQSHCSLILDGYLARHTSTAGQRQILSFHIPGDIPDLDSLFLPQADYALSSIGPAVVGFIPHGALRDMLASSQNLTRAFWRETLVDSAIFRAWVINLGRRDAMARIGHLLCELAERHRAAGLEKEGVMPLPWTQVDVADACGISAVHANRAIQELRRLGLVQWDSKRVRICNPGELSRRAEFSPDYLHLEPLEVYAA